MAVALRASGIARRRTEEERADMFVVGERRRRRRIPSAMCEQRTKRALRASGIARRRTEEERADMFVVGERRRRRRIPSAMCEQRTKRALRASGIARRRTRAHRRRARRGGRSRVRTSERADTLFRLRAREEGNGYRAPASASGASDAHGVSGRRSFPLRATTK